VQAGGSSPDTATVKPNTSFKASAAVSFACWLRPSAQPPTGLTNA